VRDREALIAFAVLVRFAGRDPGLYTKDGARTRLVLRVPPSGLRATPEELAAAPLLATEISVELLEERGRLTKLASDFATLEEAKARAAQAAARAEQERIERERLREQIKAEEAAKAEAAKVEEERHKRLAAAKNHDDLGRINREASESQARIAEQEREKKERAHRI
jgi:hypothetical protein